MFTGFSLYTDTVYLVYKLLINKIFTSRYCYHIMGLSKTCDWYILGIAKVSKEELSGMSSYVLSCCSTADLTKEQFTKRDISYICFHYELDGVQYMDDLGESMPFDKFYQAMADGADTKTSQINASEFEEYFEPFLKEGKDILHVTLSSGISGVYNSANIAKDILEERYPDRKIYIVDSLAASSGYGLFMDRLADLRDNGMGIEELTHWGKTLMLGKIEGRRRRG